MESIDKLREYADKLRVYPGVMSWGYVATIIGSIADEIEDEISERYMPLPLDADGVPCKVGDMVEFNGREYEVFGVSEDGVYVNNGDIWMLLFPRGDMHHAKPRTIEDVLDDYRRELVETWACTLDDEMTDAEDEITARYADELRGMK